MKKYYNWKGIMLIIFAVVISLIFPIFAYVSYSENDMSSVLAFAFGELLTVITLVILVPGYYKAWHRETVAKNMYNILPDLSAEVIVVAKSKRTVGNRFSTGNIFFLTFEFEDGERKNFRVSHDNYMLIEKGDKCILTYKEDGEHLFFVKFKRIKDDANDNQDKTGDGSMS